MKETAASAPTSSCRSALPELVELHASSSRYTESGAQGTAKCAARAGGAADIPRDRNGIDRDARPRRQAPRRPETIIDEIIDRAFRQRVEVTVDLAITATEHQRELPPAGRAAARCRTPPQRLRHGLRQRLTRIMAVYTDVTEGEV